MSPILISTPVPEEERYVETKHGREKQVLSNDICCICNKRIWITSRAKCSMMSESFSIDDPRVYINGTPDYLKTSNSLLRCHYDCKPELTKQIINNTFIKR